MPIQLVIADFASPKRRDIKKRKNMGRSKEYISGRKSQAISTNTTNVVDTETGEVIKVTNTEVGSKETEPPFVKVYVTDMSRLLDISPAASKIIHLLLRNVGYNNVVAMYKPIKEMMIQELGIKMSTLNNAVQDLCDKGILLRKARGLYILDPDQFGRGSWRDIKKLRLTVEYDENGRKRINTEKFSQLQLDF